MKDLYLFIFTTLLLSSTSLKLLGIDLSKWDETVYWDKLKKDVKFVILRAGIGKDVSDVLYEKYYKKCKEYKIPVGAYWYAKATTVSGAKNEAFYTIKRLKGKKFEYPIYYDIEDKPIFETGKINISNMVKEFCSILEKNKYLCGIYSSKSYLENYFTDEVKNKYQVWLAHYGVKQTNYKGKYQIWQYTDKARLASKPGDCDLNYAYVDYPKLIQSRRLNGY